MKKEIIAFFDRLEEKLENIFEGSKGEKRIKKGMDMYTEKRVTGDFLIVSFDLPMLIGQIFGFDARLYAVIMVILSFIPAEICIHYLNKRIEAQETEELAEDLEDDIERVSLTVGIIGGIMFVILALLFIRL